MSKHDTGPGGPQFEGLASRHDGGSYLGAPIPDDQAEMTSEERLRLVRRLVKEAPLFNDDELRDAIKADSRRGRRSRSRAREDITESHLDMQGDKHPGKLWKLLKRPEDVNPRVWEFLRQHLVEGLTAKEIAKRDGTGVRADAVSKSLVRAKEALRATGQLPAK